MSNLEKECAEILRKIMVKHQFLNPESVSFDCWSSEDAEELVADLVEAIKYSSEIEHATSMNDWGK